MSWTIPAHPLRWPLTLPDGTKLAEVTLRPILHGEHADVMATHEDDDDRFLALLEVASGLPQTTLEQLKRPDYTSLEHRVFDLVTKSAPHFMQAADSRAYDADAPKLLHPIKDGQQTIDALTLEVPSLSVTRTMKRITDPVKRAEFITSHCTGLALPLIADLSCPDWNALQERLNAFLNEPADSFPSETSKRSRT